MAISVLIKCTSAPKDFTERFVKRENDCWNEALPFYNHRSFCKHSAGSNRRAFSYRFDVIQNGKPLAIAEQTGNKPCEGLEIEELKMYISGLELLKGDLPVFSESNSYHLLDAADTGSLGWQLSIPAGIAFDRIRFHVGVDSLTNVSGAFGGDLDPTRGMYWTWQSGYINFKLEGRAESCPARHNRFQFHIGGYMAPYASLQTVSLDITNREKINIDLSVDEIFNQINIGESYQIMSPGEQSLAFASLIPSIFSLSK
ncbi:MAG: MbnP family protein [Bacteroidia bacterium]